MVSEQRRAMRRIAEILMKYTVKDNDSARSLAAESAVTPANRKESELNNGSK